ncbi:MAG: flavin reductase (DIM6/NTAB) family NADH-FMN oxidoreductase RutF [Flammeovirgaceae bacterium]|jgi:flavin reductase (DIM6/NTAB) family NADH-FMN oxidoreductase RutF
MKISLAIIEAFEKRYRGAFINSLTGFKSVNLVGTISKVGNHNLAIFSQVFHLGADPALIGMIVRPHVTPRHTLENLMETGFYTLNHLNESIYEQAHQTSARYEEGVSEFEATDLNPVFIDSFPAPYVTESEVKIGLKFEQKLDLEINKTVLIIGSIQEVHLAESLVGEDGFVDLEQAGTVTSSGLDSYHRTQKLARLPYAKVGEE